MELVVPLDLPPPREIPEDERILRYKKEKQLKVKELVKLYSSKSIILGIERKIRTRRERKIKTKK